MGRQLRRVSLDFSWPLNKVWEGFLNPLHTAKKCDDCDGTGSSPAGRQLYAEWYGYVPFNPEAYGSVPFTREDIRLGRTVQRNVDFFVHDSLEGSVSALHRKIIEDRECDRLLSMWNNQWSHHLNDDDVAALIDGGRLYDLTSTWTEDHGWVKKEAPPPTAREVNLWSLSGIGHDGINQWICTKARALREGIDTVCSRCGGEGEHWPSQEAKDAYESWKEVEPPEGEGWQMWETVSEGSPISPVFAMPQELARYLSSTHGGADKGTSYEAWMDMIVGDGWAISMIMQDGVIKTGVQAQYEMKA